MKTGRQMKKVLVLVLAAATAAACMKDQMAGEPATVERVEEVEEVEEVERVEESEESAQFDKEFQKEEPALAPAGAQAALASVPASAAAFAEGSPPARRLARGGTVTRPSSPTRAKQHKGKDEVFDGSSDKSAGLGGVFGLGQADSASRLMLASPAGRPEPTSVREGYRNYGVNEMTRTAEDRLSTFSIDVDTGAYTIARRKLTEGTLPPAASVRVEEFVNYFRYDYPAPDGGPDRGAFGVHLEAAPSPFTADPNTYLVRVGVQGKRLSRAERKPVHLTFLVDVSGSMGSQDKLALAQEALKLLTTNLREGDTVALATYAGRVAKILDPTGMQERGKILEAIDQLSSGGGTGMNSGMELAYKLALTNFQRDHVNRVIVLSDGDANIGPSSHEQIHAQIRRYVEEGVTMSTIGFGMGNYKDTMMEQLANKGNGNYYYIDDMDEARKVFGDQLDGTLQVIAKDVKIQVEFDPALVPEYRLIGYENRDIADKDFRDDRVDAGEIGAGHSVTALYEIKLAEAPREAQKAALATVRIRAKKPDGHRAEEGEFHLHDGDVRAKLSDASRDFQFAAAVAAFAEILRESPYAERISLELVEEIARASSSPKEADRAEFLELIAKAKKLSRG